MCRAVTVPECGADGGEGGQRPPGYFGKQRGRGAQYVQLNCRAATKKEPAFRLLQAVAAAATFGDDEVVIKSQILAGGRGLGTFTNGFKGGVHVLKTSQVRTFCLPYCFGWMPQLPTPHPGV